MCSLVGFNVADIMRVFASLHHCWLLWLQSSTADVT